ncbi:hypothetical protein A9K65_033605 (plasmid) [Mesorhizobium sp. WSM1497]|uniref:Uncharacterized protein n=1 Tax=Mesorhizobium ciceri biovar biserrulae (strain HAMBI 2942 / LMG 23838 / WSM1271) TaxID=765698 RepID=E8TPQ3_MESCW|nr:hypothetical protein Mesci_6302 [Mesorhizobium ciceri biovar biserrulae WSM1271]ARP68565.1 hypothetical protein A9K65_033605 [Mesorhizobium sp. WSM1497]RUZ77667.1 hypothetical protein EN943_13035 [Mesorhizobium sp. M7A.F.Ca.US.006.01.1.1]
MHRLPILPALLISFGIAYGICVWATSDKPVSFFEAQAASQMRGTVDRSEKL